MADRLPRILLSSGLLLCVLAGAVFSMPAQPGSGVPCGAVTSCKLYELAGVDATYLGTFDNIDGIARPWQAERRPDGLP